MNKQAKLITFQSGTSGPAREARKRTSVREAPSLPKIFGQTVRKKMHLLLSKVYPSLGATGQLQHWAQTKSPIHEPPLHYP